MTLNCRGKLISLKKPKIMGILNVTPNSFYDGGFYKNKSEVLSQTEKLLNEGADFIDIGGCSSKPGTEEVSQEEELNRILPAIETILKKLPKTLISVDTFRSEVAAESLNAGACMINDISAGSYDQNMMKTVAKFQVPYIMMHIKGTPKTMRQKNHYNDLLKDLIFYFSEKIEAARSAGINDLIIDPGFGFAKNSTQNFELLKKMKLLENL
jgi:dihydropteroate synthase